MTMIPVVASAEEIPDALEYAETHRNSRWFISRRIQVLGKPELIPEEWGLTAAASSNHLKSSRRKLGTEPSWPVPTGRPGLAQTQTLAGDADPGATDGSDIAGQLARVQQLSDSELTDLAGRITAEFHAADEADDLDAMKHCGAWIDTVEAEQARRKAPAPRALAASGRTSGMAAPVVPADRAPRGAGPKSSGNVVVQARGEEPGWLSLVDYVLPSGKGRQAHAEADAENARRVAAAQEADRRLSVDAERIALAAAIIDVHDIAWPPFRLLLEAASANPDAPAWCVTSWGNALISPTATIQPLVPDEQVIAYATPVGTRRDRWVAHHVAVQLAGDRPNVTPDPALAQRPAWPSPECSWVATDEGLLAALLELQTGPDLTAVVRGNRLVGDSPAARLAAMVVGPGRGDRGMDNGPMAAYGPGSRLESFAEQLRGGAPEPADTTVLDALSPEQRQALATLATAATT